MSGSGRLDRCPNCGPDRVIVNERCFDCGAPIVADPAHVPLAPLKDRLVARAREINAGRQQERWSVECPDCACGASDDDLRCTACGADCRVRNVPLVAEQRHVGTAAVVIVAVGIVVAVAAILLAARFVAHFVSP